MKTNLRTATATLVLAGLAGTVAVTAPALASGGGGGDRIIRTGSCSDGARWKIKAKEDDGLLEVEAEIDSNVTGQQWAWKLLHNGDVAYRGNARTVGRSGSFSVERRPVDLPGDDSFVFRATHRGQTCVAKVTY